MKEFYWQSMARFKIVKSENTYVQPITFFNPFNENKKAEKEVL